jgi:signal transduction histidine kinase
MSGLIHTLITSIFFLLTQSHSLFASEMSKNTGKSKTSAEANDFQNTLSVLFSASEQHRLLGNYESAMQYDFQALRIAETTGLSHETGMAYNNIGISYYRLRDFKKAEHYFLMAAGIRSSLEDTLRLADTYYNMGMLYDDMMNLDKSFIFYNKSLSFFRQKNLLDGMADAYNGLAGHYYLKGNIDSVGFYASKALEMYVLLEKKESVAFMQLNLAVLKNIQGKYGEAISDIRQALDFALETNNLNMLRQGYRTLSETYSYMGDFENAYVNQQLYIQYKDSIFNREKTEIIEELQTKYETDKALKELNEKKAELLQMEVDVQKTKNVRNIFILALVFIAILTVMLYKRFSDKQKTARLLDSKNKVLNELVATKDRFFSIISHDLKSPVSSLAKLAGGLEQTLDHLHPEDLKNYLSELSKTTQNLNEFLKKLLDWALSQKGGLCPVFEEHRLQELLNEVIETAHLQAELKNVNIQCLCEAEITIFADSSMILTVLRNLISNAIRFADNHTLIHVQSSSKNGEVKVSVSNTGPGIRDEDVDKLFRIDGQANMIQNHTEKGSGLGLILCQELVKIHNGSIFLENNKPEMTTFSFIIPHKQCLIRVKRGKCRFTDVFSSQTAIFFYNCKKIT